MSLTIGVDVGGTKVAAGVVDDHGRIVEKLRRATPAASPERTAAVIAEVVTELLTAVTEVQAVGVGAAGFMDEAGGTVAFAPNLAWRDEPLAQQVEGLVGPAGRRGERRATPARGRRSGSARRAATRMSSFVSVGHGHRGRLHAGRQALPGPVGDGR